MCHPSEYVDPPQRPGALRHEVEIEVPGGERLPARLAAPQGELRGAVVVATDIFGANAFYRGLIDRLAGEGIATLLPDLFFREGKLEKPTRELAYERRARLDDDRALDELFAASTWLRERGAIRDGRIGTLGFCLGGNLVLHMAARSGDLATVSYYAFPAGLPAPKGAPPPQDVVPELSGPILALWGDLDEKVGMDNVDRFESAVAARDIDYEQRIYPGVDHGFLAGLDDPKATSHSAATDSWRLALAFFGQHLGRSQTGRIDL